MCAALAVVAFGLAYGVLLALGLASLDRPDAPIGDPWFTILELLIVAMMPALVILMAALPASAFRRSRTLRRWALNFMLMTAALTLAVHVAILVLGRTDVVADDWRALLLSFEWPSLPYALDILAWDLFFALSMFCAAPLFRGTFLKGAIRATLLLSGTLALAGLAGPLTGNMQLRNIGILGYALVFPIAAALMALHFGRTAVRAPR